MLNLKPIDKLEEGESVEIKGMTLIVPPFNIKRRRATIPDRAVLRKINGSPKPDFDTEEGYDASVHIVMVALKPNYPDITEEFIEENFTDRNLADVLDASNRANLGGRKPTAGEAQSPNGLAIGTGLPPASVLPLDGPGDMSKTS